MSWGRVTQDGGVEPIKKPEPIEPETFDNMPEPPPELADLNAAIEEAKAYELPGTPSSMIPNISVANFEPSAGAINSALGRYGH